MNTIVIIIPEVILKPKFDLVDSEGNERELTKEELDQMADYLDRKINYEDISHLLNKWPVNGAWERVIDDKGPIVTKDEKRYFCYTLPVERIDRGDVKSWLYRQDLEFSEKLLGIHTGYTKDVGQWLKENNYVKHLTEAELSPTKKNGRSNRTRT